MKVIKFSANWCMPCKRYEPMFEKVSKDEEFNDIEFKVLDVEENEETCKKYKILSVPTTLILDDEDNIVFKETGIMSVQELTDAIKRFH